MSRKKNPANQAPDDRFAVQFAADQRLQVVIVFGLILLFFHLGQDSIPFDKVHSVSSSQNGKGVYLQAESAEMSEGEATPVPRLIPLPLSVGSPTGNAALHSFKTLPGNEPPQRVAALFFQPIAINRASQDELTLLPGIGPHMAMRIVELRTARGGITHWRDLLMIKGISENKLAHLREHAFLD